MKRTILLLIIFFPAAVVVSAQSITLDLPFHAGLQVTLSLKNGIHNDTVHTGNLDDKGSSKIAIPDKYKDYRGIASLHSSLPGVFYEFIISEEDITLHCPDQYLNGDNVVFKNSPENNSLQSWFKEQAVRRQKAGMLSELLRLYDKKESLFHLMEKEKENLETEQAAFEKMLSKSPLYAARLILLHNFLVSDISGLVYADSASMSQTRLYLTDSLDVNCLYTSGLWFDVLNGSLALYDEQTPYHSYFINDMSKLLSRSGDKVYTTLAENLFAICETTGWNDLEEQLAYYLINDGRVVNPTGKLKMLMTLFKLGKGSKAPGISFGALPQGKVLLVFYESGCNACDNEMQQLKGNYSLLKERGYEVVSVSADTDADIFRNTSGSFPWKARYCDLQGLSGTDFRNFGVIGTPTFYVLDKDGIVQGRYARLEDTGIIK